MTNLLKQYEDLSDTIKERAIHANNMLSELEVGDDLYCLLPNHCYVDSKYLQLTVEGGYVVLTHQVPYENYTEDWKVSIAYIDADDDYVKEDYLSTIQTQHDIEQTRQMSMLRNRAKSLGYKLVEDKDE